MMNAFLQFIFGFYSINLIGTTTFPFNLNLPESDFIIKTDKAIALERIGRYISQLKMDIVHSIIPLNNPCVASPSTDVCMFISNTAYPNIVEISTLRPSRDKITILPYYDNNYISNYIRNDIARILEHYHLDKLIIEQNATFHLTNNQFHLSNPTRKSLTESTNFLPEIDNSNILQILPTSYTTVFKQIAINKIGFEFLNDIELKSLLSAVVSIIDESYQIVDLYKLLNLFSDLILAQSTYILRSCSHLKKHISPSRSCLIVSTLFFRPSIRNNNEVSVYRIIPLPAIVNNEHFVYSNMPEAISVNKQNQSVMLWDNISKQNNCLFSIFIYCQNQIPFIHLSHLPCLSELFNEDTQIVNSCPISHSRKVQTNIINIQNNIWLFSHNEQPLHCQIQSSNGEYTGFIVINEPSILQLPCSNTMKCLNTELVSSTCSDRSVSIKSLVTGKYESLTIFPLPIKNMTQQLLSTYKLTLKNSLIDIFDDPKDNRLSIDMIIELIVIILCAIFLLFLSFILFFITWMKRLVTKRVETIERDIDDYIHEHV